jgi:hypothetical protein
MNDPMLYVLLTIAGFFFGLMILRSLTGWRFCVLCASVSSTWILYLTLYGFKQFEHLVLIAVLTGGTVVGLYYWVEQHTPETMHVFRLPFFLTLLLAAYQVLGIGEQNTIAALTISLLWLMFGGIFLYQHNPKINRLAKHLIECCRNW